MARRRTASADKTDLGIYFLRLFIDLGEMVLQYDWRLMLLCNFAEDDKIIILLNTDAF